VENQRTGEANVIYDDNDLEDKVVHLTDAEVSTIRSWLFELDKREGLNFRNIKTYEKFCLREANGNTIDNMDAA
jgi:hypothetical protein